MSSPKSSPGAATPPHKWRSNRPEDLDMLSPTKSVNAPAAAVMYAKSPSRMFKQEVTNKHEIARRKKSTWNGEEPEKPQTPGERARLLTTFRSLSPDVNSRSGSRCSSRQGSRPDSSMGSTMQPSAAPENPIADPTIKLGDYRTFGGEEMYVTSYKKTYDKTVDDYHYETHENESFRRSLPEKKTPIMLLQQVAMKMMSRHGGSRALRKAFTDVDLDGNGTLDFQEVQAALNSFNIECTEEECQGLFKAMGADDDGAITYNDFRSAIEDGLTLW